MSYGNYGQGGGYGQSNPYNNQTANPYNDDVELNQYGEPAPAPAGRYEGGGLPSGPRTGGAGGYNSGGGGYEGAGYGRSGGNAGGNILNQCRDIDQAIDDLGDRLSDLKQLQHKVLNDRATSNELERSNSETLAAYKNLGERLKKIKSNPESGNPTNAPQVGRVDRKLKKAINDFQRVETDHRAQIAEMQVRQFRIVNPNASPEDVASIREDTNTEGIFSNALMSSNRQGQANSTLSVVRQRHDEIQSIERTMMELGQLFEDLDRIVMEHEPLIQNIEQKGEEVQQNIEAGVGELGKGVKSARAARKKKWICFWLVITIIVVVVLIVVIYMAVTGKFSKSKDTTTPAAKRWLLHEVRALEARAAPMMLMAPGGIL